MYFTFRRNYSGTLNNRPQGYALAITNYEIVGGGSRFAPVVSGQWSVDANLLFLGQRGSMMERRGDIPVPHYLKIGGWETPSPLYPV